MSRGKLWVRTFGEGAFSALGHDLEFELATFEVVAQIRQSAQEVVLETTKYEQARRLGSIEVAVFERKVQRAAHDEHDAEPLFVVDGFTTGTAEARAGPASATRYGSIAKRSDERRASWT